MEISDGQYEEAAKRCWVAGLRLGGSEGRALMRLAVSFEERMARRRETGGPISCVAPACMAWERRCRRLGVGSSHG